MRVSRPTWVPLALVAGVVFVTACGHVGAVGAPGEGKATHALIRRKGLALDIWRQRPGGLLVFRWRGDTDVTVFDPKTLIRTEITDGRAAGSTRYLSGTPAWSDLRAEFGLTRHKIDSALARGSTWTDPVPGLAAARHKPGFLGSNTLYGSNLHGLSRAVGFPVPRLASLGGHRLAGSSATRDLMAGHRDHRPVAVLWFGSDSQISVNIAPPGGGKGSMGSINASMYRSGRWKHFPARRGCPAYLEVAGDVVAPYGAEWLSIHPERNQTRQEWCALLAAIDAAPPA